MIFKPCRHRTRSRGSPLPLRIDSLQASAGDAAHTTTCVSIAFTGREAGAGALAYLLLPSALSRRGTASPRAGIQTSRGPRYLSRGRAATRAGQRLKCGFNAAVVLPGGCGATQSGCEVKHNPTPERGVETLPSGDGASPRVSPHTAPGSHPPLPAAARTGTALASLCSPLGPPTGRSARDRPGPSFRSPLGDVVRVLEAGNTGLRPRPQLRPSAATSAGDWQGHGREGFMR